MLGVHFLGYTVCTIPLKLVDALAHLAPTGEPKDDIPNRGLRIFPAVLESSLNHFTENQFSIDSPRSGLYQFLNIRAKTIVSTKLT